MGAPRRSHTRSGSRGTIDRWPLATHLPPDRVSPRQRSTDQSARWWHAFSTSRPRSSVKTCTGSGCLALARAETVEADSDIDLLVVAHGGDERYGGRMVSLVFQAADDTGADPITLSVHTYDPERVEQRRAIRSFFIQEVDRDKIVLAGSG